MNTLQNIIPQPPPNCKVLYPKYRDTKTNTWHEYQSTGYFLMTAKDKKRAGHEAKATALLLDCDLVDFMMHEQGLTDQQKVDMLDQKKQEMYNGTVQELVDLKNRFISYLESVIIEIGVEPSICSWSGWGVHILWWLPENMGWHERTNNVPSDNPNYIGFQEVVHRQRDFTQAVNRWCGFHFTDGKCKDAGTRLLRPLGSFNRKAPNRPIEVKVVNDLSTGNRISEEQLQRLQSWTETQLNSTQNNNQRRQQTNTNTNTNTNIGQQFNQQNNNNNNNNQNAGGGGRFQVQYVTGDIQIHLGDNNYTTFQEIIDNWDNYANHPNFRAQTGRLQVVSPGSQNTVGSAFIHRTLNLLHNFHMYVMTSNRNRCHYRCYTSHNSVYLDFGRNGNNGEKIVCNASNMKKILLSQSHDYMWNQRTMECLRDGQELKNEDFVVLAQRFEERYFPDKKIDPKVAQRALLGACMEKQIDPLKDYLNGLPQWDGTDRVSNLFTKYLKADDEHLYKVYAKKFLIACIARALDWGCKQDVCLVLKGEQGVRKSGFWETLCKTEFFMDDKIDIGTKDGMSLLKRGWFVEFAELESMNGKDVNKIKSFLTKKRDTYRPPYGTKEDQILRRNVFVGTTNEDRFLKDKTGSRRFWIVECGGEPNIPVYDENELSNNRDQIWAQALHYYKQGDIWWLTKDEESISVDHKEKYQVSDPHEELLLEWIDNNPDRTFTIPEMIQEAYVIKEDTDFGVKYTSKVIKPKSYKPYYSEVLPKLGCIAIRDGKRIRINGKRGRFWKTPTDQPTDNEPPPQNTPPQDSTENIKTENQTSEKTYEVELSDREIKKTPTMSSDDPLPRNYENLVHRYFYEGPNISRVEFKDGTSKTFFDLTKAEQQFWMKKSIKTQPKTSISEDNIFERYDE